MLADALDECVDYLSRSRVVFKRDADGVVRKSIDEDEKLMVLATRRLEGQNVERPSITRMIAVVKGIRARPALMRDTLTSVQVGHLRM